jgi:hypothetical protein
MACNSTIIGEIEAPSVEALNKILDVAEELFDKIDTSDETPAAEFYGIGKYYDESTVPFYGLCASLGCTGYFEITGEWPDDMERVDISPGKIERRYAVFPNQGEGDITEVPLAKEATGRTKAKSRTAAPGL